MAKSGAMDRRNREMQMSQDVESWPTEQQAPYQSMQDPAETARYIAQLTAELSALAGGAQLQTLAYLLSMARVEAEMIARAQED